MSEELIRHFDEAIANYKKHFGGPPTHISLGPGLYDQVTHYIEFDKQTNQATIGGIRITKNSLLADHAIVLKQAHDDSHYWTEWRNPVPPSVPVPQIPIELGEINKSQTKQERIEHIKIRIGEAQIQNDDRSEASYDRRLDRLEIAIDKLIEIIVEDQDWVMIIANEATRGTPNKNKRKVFPETGAF